MRFFTCEEDLSHEPPDAPLADAVGGGGLLRRRGHSQRIAWLNAGLASLASPGCSRDNDHDAVYFDAGSLVMSRATLEERVAALEKQVGALLAIPAGTGRAKDWRRTRGVFTGDDLMKQIFEEGRKIRDAERKRAQPRSRKKQQPRL